MVLDDRNTRGGGGYSSGDVWEIDNGWDVFGSDGEKVGDVEDVQSYYITVSKGFFFPTERYIPVSAIANVEQDRVYLNVSKDYIESAGWDNVPDDTMTTGVTSGTTYTDVDTTSTSYTDVDTSRRGYTDVDTTRVDTGLRTGSVTDRDEIEVPVVEEQLTVSKREVERGRVIVRKGVVSEQQTVNVPLRQEEVHVERRVVDGTYAGGDIPADAFQEREIEIPVRGEEVDVSKQAVVREVVEIGKDVEERTEQVSDTVRREEVYVEGADTGTTTGRTGRSSRRDIDTGTRGVTDTAGADPGEGALGRLEDRLDPTPNKGGKPTGS